MKGFFHGPVGLFYSFIVLYILLVPVDSGVVNKVLATLFVCSILGLVLLGYFSVRKSGTTMQTRYGQPALTLKVPVLIIQYALAVYVGYFYTGLSLVAALGNLFSGVSNYALYQSYFSEAGLAAFSLDKLPAVFSYFLVKMIFVYFVFVLLASSKEKVPGLWIAAYALPVMLIGLFRGTNIEFFEVFIIVICALFIRSLVVEEYKFPLLKASISAVLLVVVYSLQINFRYAFDYSPSCPNEFCFNEDSVVYKLVPGLYSLSGYFFFAPDYMARWFQYFINDYSIFGLFLPGNGALFDYEPRWLCSAHMSCGPTWAPDMERLIYIFGGVGAAFIVISLGAAYKVLQRSAGYSFVDFLGFYLVSLQIVSLPIGGFLFVSSANQLMLICFVGLFFVRYISKRSSREL